MSSVRRSNQSVSLIRRLVTVMESLYEDGFEVGPSPTDERIADSLERLVIAADQIATALQLQALKAHPTQETLDELIARHTRITEADSGH